MIEELNILNGDLELKFNRYTYEYTVKVSNDVTSLDFSYKLGNDCNINIRNNYLDNNNIVYVDIYNVDESITYTFNVYKENTISSSGIDNYKKSLEVVDADPNYEYKVEGLIIGLFFTIIIIFSIIFRRKKVMSRK